jgi:imidazolonepropionase-like amidohydrolase
LRLFVANGVTTVLNLYGTPYHLELRERVRRGQTFGPTIYTSGPFISDAPVHSPTPEEVEEAVAEQKRAGYDFVKIHGDFSREAYRRLFAVARREGMRVIGHAPRNLGTEPMFEERQDAVAHAEEYLYAYFYLRRNKAIEDADQASKERYVAAQEAKIPYLAQATAKAGTWVIPNLTAYKTIGLQVADLDAVLRRHEVRFVPPRIAIGWAPENNTYAKRFKGEQAVWYFRAQYGLLEKVVKGFRDAGVRMLTGTDTPIPSVVPGFSIHDELAALVAAGLTPFEALSAATASASEFLGAGSEAGTIEAGRRADLILIAGDPLRDVSQAARRVGVMVRGRWVTEPELGRMLMELASDR